MLRDYRYNLLFWGRSPHQVGTLIPEFVSAVGRAVPGFSEWHIEGKPSQPMPRSLRQWADLEAKGRAISHYGALVLAFEVPDGARGGRIGEYA